MPDVPQMEEGSFQVIENLLSFKIVRDENAGLYEVVLQEDAWMVRDRFLRPNQGNINVEFSIAGVPKGGCLLKIYAFDKNLSEYFTANLSSKPNVYQKEFSTVENGYGCFGALNIFVAEIEL